MARYTGPKARVNRRFGALLFESAGAARAFAKRENPPGMHPKPRRTSNYGIALAEKQKIKYYYGLGERQLRRYFDDAVGRKGNTGETLLLMCERRLDNIVRRVGFTKTRPQSRQGIVHGHFLVNGVKVSSPSFICRPGDIIEVRNRDSVKNMYRGVIANFPPTPMDWLNFDTEELRVTVAGNPGPSDISLPVNANIVVEFLSR
ncbi:MAG: 30S ribosomal protein S4 [Planctomycetota bacterium]|nr:30S ribosomal protein S4 [Planctomycetota bacterium]